MEVGERGYTFLDVVEDPSSAKCFRDVQLPLAHQTNITTQIRDQFRTAVERNLDGSAKVEPNEYGHLETNCQPCS